MLQRIKVFESFKQRGGKLSAEAESFVSFVDFHIDYDPQSVLVGHMPHPNILELIGLASSELMPSPVSPGDISFPKVSLCAEPRILVESLEPGMLVVFMSQPSDQHQGSPSSSSSSGPAPTLPLSCLRYGRLLELSSQFSNHVMISQSVQPKSPNNRLLVSTNDIALVPATLLRPLLDEASPHILKSLAFDPYKYLYTAVSQRALDLLVDLLKAVPHLDQALLLRLLSDQVTMADYPALRTLTEQLNQIYQFVDPSIIVPKINDIPYFPDSPREQQRLDPEARIIAASIAKRLLLVDLEFLGVSRAAVTLLQEEPPMAHQVELSREVTKDGIAGRTVSRSFRQLTDRAGQCLITFEASFRSFHSGDSFKSLRSWWLELVRTGITKFLGNIGFSLAPLTDLNVGPNTHREAIQKNLALLSQLLSDPSDPHDLVKLISRIINDAYGNIDTFIDKGFTVLSIALQRPLSDIKHLDAEGERYLNTLDGDFKWIRGVREDLEFLVVMKEADMAFLSSPSPLSLVKPALTIPLYSIIVDRLKRYQQELSII